MSRPLGLAGLDTDDDDDDDDDDGGGGEEGDFCICPLILHNAEDKSK